MTYPEKLQAIRAQMAADGVSAYIIPSADPHMSEYLPEHYKCISFTTGFKGSVSTVVITPDFAGLWADFRYFEQAESQLKDSGFELVKLKVQHAPEYIGWLKERLPEQAIIAYDERLVSVLLGDLLHQQLGEQAISFIHRDYLEPIWTDRPALPASPAFLIDVQYTGASITEKLNAVRTNMRQNGSSHHFISSLDDIAWLFNLRGADVSFNPVVLSFALITNESQTLYIQLSKLSGADRQQLEESAVKLAPYEAAGEALGNLQKGDRILIDPKRTCYALFKLIPPEVSKVLDTNPSTYLKAIKNETEIRFTREAMVKDGVAITRFMKWLEEHIGNIEISELSASAKLREFRAEQSGFIGESFNTIAGYRAHGALPHYAASKESNASLQSKGLFLIDSGGQYRYGTTDITRVLSLGDATEEEKKDYTLVLKGMIEGCKTRFPKGTCGYAIDAITRRPLWDEAINYGHGTGHGVGYFLNVHEGPHVFNATATAIAIEPGTITSIEPGIYRPGKHGIRIENLVLTIRDESNLFNDFYRFEALTLAPIDTRLVQKELLEKAHIDWLNHYHDQVYAQLSPWLNEDDKGYLKQATAAI